LDDEGISPLPFERVKNANPHHTERVLRDVLNDPTFDIENDFEDLMRDFKDWYFTQPKLPAITVVV
jgi:hypothetical protein